MFQLISVLIFMLISSVLLATQSVEMIKCELNELNELNGKEQKVYVFDFNQSKYKVSLLENGKPKTSLSRQIQQFKPLEETPTFKEYQFVIDDKRKVLVKFNPKTMKGTGELIHVLEGNRVKSFSKCDVIAAK